jgi:hypothetical protein
MAELLERVKLSNLVYGDGIVENYKNNSIYFYNKYSKSDDEVRSIQVGDIQIGRFYFLHYKDDSNWVKYSPVFTIGFKKFENLVIVMAINFNLIPLGIRVSFFDNFILEEDFEQDRALKVDFDGVYKELMKYGFEYAIMEYNASQIILSHRINMSAVPRFLYAGHPINIYDPGKLYSIWKVKLNTKYQRDQEMSKSLIKDFYEISGDINENYKILKNHIQRLQTSINKYGRPS